MKLSEDKELMSQLNIDKSLRINKNILNENISSRKEAVWICKLHGDYIQKIQYRHYGYTGCKICDKINKYEGRTEYVTDIKLLDSVKINFEQCEIDSINPYNIIKTSDIKIPWICIHGHTWYTEARSMNRAMSGCPICIRRKDTRKDSIAIKRPDLVQFYDNTKNEYSAYEIGINSLDKVWWICKNGHSFKSEAHTQNYIKYPADNVRCPYCSGNILLLGKNDFRSSHPELMIEWDWDANNALGIYPDKISRTSHAKIHWICHNNNAHKWVTTAYIRDRGSGCPYCFKARQTSSREVAIALLIKQYTNENTIIRNREFGIEIDALSKKLKLGIEYHGMAFHDIETSQRDILKYNTLKSQGYEFIIIREYRDLQKLEEPISLCKIDNINNILYNIGNNYETFNKLLYTLNNRILSVYVTPINIDYNNLLNEAKRFIGMIV